MSKVKADMSVVRQAVCEAFWAMCAADSMSMPVHWYYNIQDIRRDFGGWISAFRSPADKHPSSILSLSNTGEVSHVTHSHLTGSDGSVCLL